MITCLIIEIAFVIGVLVAVFLFITMVLGRKSHDMMSNNEVAPPKYYETENLHFDDRYDWKTLKLTRQAWKPDFRVNEEVAAEETSEE